jgi:hypothetical protein
MRFPTCLRRAVSCRAGCLILAAVLVVPLAITRPCLADPPGLAAPATCGGLATCWPVPLGALEVHLGNRTHMLQLALAAMALAIFILTRGRWK